MVGPVLGVGRVVVVVLGAPVGLDLLADPIGTLGHSNVALTLNGLQLVKGPTTWQEVATPDQEPAIQFLGESCQTIKNSTEGEPVTLEIGVW